MATTEVDKQVMLGFDLNYSLGETSGGIALIVLGILALAKVDPMLLNGIAVIVAGIALLILDGRSAGASSYGRVSHAEAVPVADGIGAGVFAGIAGIVLGILAILDITAPTLMAVAVIVFGAAVLFDFAAKAQLNAMRMQSPGAEPSARPMLPPAGANTSAVLVGAALITLGILALAGMAASILVTVALLSLGGYLFLQSAVTNSLLGMAS